MDDFILKHSGFTKIDMNKLKKKKRKENSSWGLKLNSHIKNFVAPALNELNILL